MLENVAFFQEKGKKKSPDIQHCKWGREEPVSCLNVFVRYCSSASFHKELG